jgi:hypothetical protein
MDAGPKDHARIQDDGILPLLKLSFLPRRDNQETVNLDRLNSAPLPLLISKTMLFNELQVSSFSQELKNSFLARSRKKEKGTLLLHPVSEKPFAERLFILFGHHAFDQVNVEMLMGSDRRCSLIRQRISSFHGLFGLSH